MCCCLPRACTVCLSSVNCQDIAPAGSYCLPMLDEGLGSCVRGSECRTLTKAEGASLFKEPCATSALVPGSYLAAGSKVAYNISKGHVHSSCPDVDQQCWISVSIHNGLRGWIPTGQPNDPSKPCGTSIGMSFMTCCAGEVCTQGECEGWAG